MDRADREAFTHRGGINRKCMSRKFQPMFPLQFSLKTLTQARHKRSIASLLTMHVEGYQVDINSILWHANLMLNRASTSHNRPSS